MRYLSNEETENLARNITAAYAILDPPSFRRGARVNPEILAEQLLGLKIEYRRLSLHGNILGATACAPIGVRIYGEDGIPEYFYLDGKTILLERALNAEGANIGRRNFTLAHECCHQLLQRMFSEIPAAAAHRGVCLYTRAEGTCPLDWEERQTNALASAILMPELYLRQNLIRFGLPERPGATLRSSTDEERIRKVADAMGVSVQALILRIRRLGLPQAALFGKRSTPVEILADE